MPIKLKVLIRKHHPSPTTATSIPAIVGPNNLAPFTIAEFKAMALPKSSFFSIISITND